MRIEHKEITTKLIWNDVSDYSLKLVEVALLYLKCSELITDFKIVPKPFNPNEMKSYDVCFDCGSPYQVIRAIETLELLQ